MRNWTLISASAVRSARYGWAFTLVLCDLNNFKAVNDRSGHAFGDDILRQFGFALRLSVRQGDTAARIGGDEFAVILSNAEGNESAVLAAAARSNSGVAPGLMPKWTPSACARSSNPRPWRSSSPSASPLHHVIPLTPPNYFVLLTPGSTRRRV